MISRILFIALDDYISVVSVSEKGKGRPIPFDGETVFKLQEDFWSSWCDQTAYVAPKNDKDNNATICDFCFVTDKDYPFANNKFLEKVVKVQETFWTVEKITDIIRPLNILKKYNGISIKMPNGVHFNVAGNNAGELVNAVTNISDMDYKRKIEEKAKLDEEKRKAKKKAIAEKKAVTEYSDTQDTSNYTNSVQIKASKLSTSKTKSRPRREGEESPLVKYNKKLIADEKVDE